MRTIDSLAAALVAAGLTACFSPDDRDELATRSAAMQIDPGGGGADNAPPIGWLDSVDAHGVASGWACDPDDPFASIGVRIRVGDGAGAPTYSATASRPAEQAVTDACGGGTAHRFLFALPASAPTVTGTPIYAFGVDSAGGPSAALSGSPRGFPDGAPPITMVHVDSVQSTLNGWACDPDEPTVPLTVELRIGSTTATPIYLTANLPGSSFGDSRCQSSVAHQFQYTANLAKGTWVYLRSINVRGGAQPALAAYQWGRPAVGELTSIATSGLVTGWACDPDLGSAAIDVELTRNGTQTWRVTANQTLLGDTVDYTTRCAWPGSAHRFSFSVGALAPGDTITARAIDLDGAPNLALAGSPKTIPNPQPPPCTGPQLAPIALSLYQGTSIMYGNKATYIDWRTTNWGTAAGARIDHVAIEWLSNGTWVPSVAGNIAMNPLAALSSDEYTTWAYLTGGTYRATVSVDAGGAVAECNEGDNVRQVVFSVQPCTAGYYCPP